MKIAYIHFSKDKNPAHENRLHALALGAKKAGIDNIEFYYLNNDRHDSTGLVKYIRFKQKIFPFNYHDFLLNRYNLIDSSMDLQQIDCLILRYPNGDPSGLNFTSKYNVITEHHSKEIPEYVSHLKSKNAVVIHSLKKIRLHLEQKYGPETLNNVKGIIGVTDEISSYEINRIQSNIPCVTIANGISVDNLKISGFKPFDGKHLDIIMVMGSIQPWQGLDRIIHSIHNYKGSVNITIHVVGNVTGKDIRQITPDASRIRLYGYRDSAQVSEIAKNMNVALGTLALFRKNMSEACPLKTREYVARGIPFIVGYHDTDLKKVDENYKFFLPVENTDSLIDMERIIDFTSMISKKDKTDSISNYMRGYALSHLDWSVKIKDYLSFIDTIKSMD